jgi:hypothetical protein
MDAMRMLEAPRRDGVCGAGNRERPWLSTWLSPFWVLALAAGCCHGQTDLPRHVIQIAQLKRNVRANVGQLSNYTCLETIERARRKSDRQPFRYTDSVRVEVAVVKDRELFSWPGANQFEERDITQMVTGGTIASGDFSSDLSAVLVNDVGTITFHGEEDLLGRRALRWDYFIPLNLSGWRVTHGGASGVVARRGSFWADAESLQLLRLESNAEEFPPGLPVAAVKIATDYARVRVGRHELLLPQRTELILTDITLGQSRNLVEFSHCREFTTETAMRFDSPAPREAEPAAVSEILLPPGLRISARLDHAVESRTTAVGDAISATLDSPVEQKGRIFVPKGATLRGRIRRLERYSDPRDHYVVGLEFTDIEFPGHHARFFGEMEDIASVAGMKTLMSASSLRSRSFPHPGNLTVYESATETFSNLPIPGVGTFYMEGKQFRVPEGLHVTWKTVDVKK